MLGVDLWVEKQVWVATCNIHAIIDRALKEIDTNSNQCELVSKEESRTV